MSEAKKAVDLTGSPEPEARVIRVDRAIRCCELSLDRALSVLSEISNAIADSDGMSAIALVPNIVIPGRTIGTVVRVVRIPFGAVIPLGMVVAIAAPLMADIVQRIGRNNLAEMVQNIGTAVRTAVKSAKEVAAGEAKQTGDCEECMMRQALPQNPNRRRKKTDVWSRR